MKGINLTVKLAVHGKVICLLRSTMKKPLMRNPSQDKTKLKLNVKDKSLNGKVIEIKNKTDRF